jgi:uncharacterized protein (TIGR00369 family)
LEPPLLDSVQADAILHRIRRIPAFEGLGIQIQEFRKGKCRAIVPHDHRYDGVAGSYHGGLLMTAADSIACFAILTQTPADEEMTTTDMNIRFLRPCFTDAVVEATVIKLGKTLCPVAVELFDTHGAKVAVAQVTYMRLPKKPIGE